MAGQVTDRPLTIAEAARAEKDASARVADHQREHAKLRHRTNIRATNRARTEWGLAFGERIEAVVALARAMDDDERGPMWAATACDGRWVLFKHDDCGQERVEEAWDIYQTARRGGDWAAIVSARATWRDELVDWQMARYIDLGREDEALYERLSMSLDDAMRADVREVIFGRPRTREQQLRHEARERARAASLRRAEARYQSGLGGWRPADR
jgi:hypothetical protein